MVTDTAAQPIETTVTPAEQEKADEAAFNSEFAKDLGAESTETPAATETPTPAVETIASTPAPVADPPKAPKYVQITEDQLQQILTGVTEIGTVKASLNKISSDAFGRLGGVEQFIKTIKEKQSETPAGQPLDLTDDDFKELKEEFPELASLIIKGQGRVLGKLKGTGTGTAGVNETVLEARRTKDAIEVLDDDDRYADWRTIVGAENSDAPYRQWLKTQPEAYQQKANQSKNPFFVMQSIDKFRQFEADQVAAAEKLKTPKTPPADPGAARRQQLTSAIAPKGAGGVEGKVEVDEFNEAYKKELKSLGL